MGDEGDWTEVAELLIQWDVSDDVQSAFLDSDIDMRTFLAHNLTTLRPYVPNKAERLKLYSNIVKFKAKQKESEGPNSSCGGGKTKSTNAIDPNAQDADTDEEPLSQLGKGSTANPEEPGSDDDNSDLPNTSEKQSTNRSKSAKSNSGQESGSMPPRLQSIQITNSFKEFDLKAHLEENLTRSVVLTCAKNGKLPPHARKLLVNILAEFMLNVTTSLSSNEFLIIREKIGELFPNEPLTLYYKAPQETGPHQALANGKLFSRVRNQITKLISKKAIEPRRKRKRALEDASDTENTADEPDEVSGLLVLLKRARELNPEVEDNWFRTAGLRLKPFYTTARKEKKRSKSKAARENEAPPQTLKEYLDEFKILRHPRGHVLVELDFKHLHPNEADNLILKWSTFLSHLEKLAHETRIDDEVGKDLLKLLKSDEFKELEENNKDAVLLQLLPSLCPPTARVIVGKSVGMLGSRDAFISYTTIAADLEPLIKKRKERMAKIAGPLQPYVIVVGPTRWDILASYVIIEDVVYHPDSIVKCLEICFKAFHALCAGYPKEANHLWHIFHLYLYKIPHDPKLEGNIPMSTASFIDRLNDL